jgi:(4S)-4-hydroxy-5-phosphonooxypentane-2,3-dione isomerase
MLVLVVKFQLKPEYLKPFIRAALADALGANEDEPGCRRFDVIQDEADPNCICFYEAYDDEAAFQAHLQTPHYLKYRETTREEWYAEPVEIRRCEALYPPANAW